MKKINRKVEESNLILKSEFDKERLLSREKEQTYSSRMSELEEKYSHELKTHSELVEELNQ